MRAIAAWRDRRDSGLEAAGRDAVAPRRASTACRAARGDRGATPRRRPDRSRGHARRRRAPDESRQLPLHRRRLRRVVRAGSPGQAEARVMFDVAALAVAAACFAFIYLLLRVLERI